MKRRLWFLGSVFAMLLILAMWYVTGYGYSNSRAKYVERWGGPDTIESPSIYGFGERRAITLGQDKNDDKYIYFFDGLELVGSYIFRFKSSLTEDPWWKSFLPPLRFGWILVVLTMLQWIMLARWFRNRTKQFAAGVPETENITKTDSDNNIDPTFRPGGFVFKLKYFHIVKYVLIALAIIICIGNMLCVLISKKLKYYIFTNGFQFESNAINIEYLFPGVLYLMATLISVFCLQKYIKSCQSP